MSVARALARMRAKAAAAGVPHNLQPRNSTLTPVRQAGATASASATSPRAQCCTGRAAPTETERIVIPTGQAAARRPSSSALADCADTRRVEQAALRVMDALAASRGTNDAQNSGVSPGAAHRLPPLQDRQLQPGDSSEAQSVVSVLLTCFACP